MSGRVVNSNSGNGLVAMETSFGWVLSGPVMGLSVCSENVNTNFSSHILCVDCCDSKLDDQLKRFWDLETLGIRNIEKSCYDDFTETITRNNENRYEIKLPFKQNHPVIHDNFEQSKKRLLKLHEKLKENPELMHKYNDIFEEQRALGIIEEISDTGKMGETYYIPHRPVIRDDKTTTKIRSV